MAKSFQAWSRQLIDGFSESRLLFGADDFVAEMRMIVLPANFAFFASLNECFCSDTIAILSEVLSFHNQ